jgi:hypothetical protein
MIFDSQAYSFGSSPNTKRRILIYVGIPLLLGGIFWITHREPAPFTGSFISFNEESIELLLQAE